MLFHISNSFKRRLAVLLSGAALTVVLAPALVQGAFLRNYPVQLTQPDGQVISCWVTGDEFHRRVHDRDGFTILVSPESGAYVYAVRQDGRVRPSAFLVGRWNPSALGIEKDLDPEAAAAGASRPPRLLASPPPPGTVVEPAPLAGDMANIAIFIRFNDESEFEDPYFTYASLFDFDMPGFNSLFNYFREASYGRLSIRTFLFPMSGFRQILSYQDSHPRKYYQPYNAVTNPSGYADDATATSREHTLLKNAVDSVAWQIPASLNVDADGDGLVDNVCFIVKGQPDGWSDLLWPHMWALYSQSASINGKRVYRYNFQLEGTLKSIGVGVLAHEMFHSLGAPDLYHYSFDGLRPVWHWDVMESDLNPPEHMGAYMKFKYGRWIDAIPEITTPGTYTLQPLTSAVNNCYKIRSPASSTEYFVLEYRKRAGTFESSLPGDGLLVYRINPSISGNSAGPPDEVYIYRPDGTLTQNGLVALANYSQDTGRTAINDATNPSSFLSNGSPGGLSISQIGPAGDVISFRVSFPASLSVTAPAGSVWTKGSNRVITWEKTGAQSPSVRIQLFRNMTRALEITPRAANSGRFIWRIPVSLPAGAHYRVRVQTTDAALSEFSPEFVIR
jgi:M6 family metalloprotease-like protein